MQFIILFIVISIIIIFLLTRGLEKEKYIRLAYIIATLAMNLLLIKLRMKSESAWVLIIGMLSLMFESIYYVAFNLYRNVIRRKLIYSDNAKIALENGQISNISLINKYLTLYTNREKMARKCYLMDSVKYEKIMDDYYDVWTESFLKEVGKIDDIGRDRLRRRLHEKIDSKNSFSEGIKQIIIPIFVLMLTIWSGELFQEIDKMGLPSEQLFSLKIGLFVLLVFVMIWIIVVKDSDASIEKRICGYMLDALNKKYFTK